MTLLSRPSHELGCELLDAQVERARSTRSALIPALARHARFPSRDLPCCVSTQSPLLSSSTQLARRPLVIADLPSRPNPANLSLFLPR